ncbi:hypothetical protein CT0861_02501 [Colletotrichum tofieldiae]|uniref:Uncharacterized protein n=1 Tax=Colletotrichum tofieldiae TaxID=708197 RepID=A0A161VGY1_9PEZI|nr:hypothetical protein CT0861_02501 [Colletotrichum tofieldiae]GKT60728.1 hypothetical protein ColTof3_08067 [Colletotrichum tofieldiae]GKT90552.1 hypothetical protein Ct61P_08402 [Colletotrichum tofieldiae]
MKNLTELWNACLADETLVLDKLTATTTIKYIEKHNKPGGAVYPKYLAYLSRYFKERVNFYNKTLTALNCALWLLICQGVFRPD